MFNVIEDNWIKTLEGHVVGNVSEISLPAASSTLDRVLGIFCPEEDEEEDKESDPSPHYLCCPSTTSTLECFPHKEWHITKHPSFECGSEFVYDVSLNLQLLGVH